MKLYFSGKVKGEERSFSLQNNEGCEICKVTIDFEQERVSNSKVIYNLGVKLKITLHNAPKIDNNEYVKNELDAISKITSALVRNLSFNKPLDEDIAITFGKLRTINIT